MDDINFDELDQAVNSVLQQAPKKEDDSMPTPAQSDAITDGDPIESEGGKAAVVMPKRRGQFMDLVHPSSDMTVSSANRDASARQLNRKASSLQPLNPEIVEMEKKETPVVLDEQAEPEQPSVVVSQTAVQDIDPTEQSSSEWPDPLDVLPVPSAEPVIQTDEALSDTEVDEPAEAQPSDDHESPFIKGTDVEKRPLGAFAVTDESPAAPPDEEGFMSQEPEAPIEEPVVQAAPLPEALAPEVISVESDDPTHMNETRAEEPTVDGAATSIAPQYHPVEEADEEVSHPVFDTKEYHQPLVPPAKKSHKAMAVLLVFLTIALVGVAVYAAMTLGVI